MIKPEMVPKEALEAGASLVLSSGFRLHPDEVLDISVAVLNAWPGMEIEEYKSPNTGEKYLICKFPVPCEPETFCEGATE